MLKSACFVALVASLAAPLFISTASAEPVDSSMQMSRERVGGVDKFGIGLDLGYPFNGLALSYYATERNMIQIEAGYHASVASFDLTEGADTGLAFRASYTGYPVVLAEGPGYSLPFFIGVGASYAFNVQDTVGWFANDIVPGSDVLTAYAPIGLQVRMRNAPVSLFAQIEPAVEFVRPDGELLRDADVNFSPRLGLGGSLHF